MATANLTGLFEKMDDKKPSKEDFSNVISAFLIVDGREFFADLETLAGSNSEWGRSVDAAIGGLQSVVGASTTAYKLTKHSAVQRRFDRLIAAENIRIMPLGEASEEEQKLAGEKAFMVAEHRMTEFLGSSEGTEYLRDAIVRDLNWQLESSDIKSAAQETLVQAVIATWAVFESFSRSFIVAWLNSDPSRAGALLRAPELKDYFGKQLVDFETMQDHGFDLSTKMGTVLFSQRRLDRMDSIKKAFKHLLNDSEVQSSFDGELWHLNQLRNLFVHNRGIVDRQFLLQSADAYDLGEKLTIDSHELERCLQAVKSTLILIAAAATRLDKSA